ncbi:MAG: hypothetical protein B9S32_09215 [Verrucomicrobia bacterium Tous-C9LFEB]|nr:MAG: hypothetical protein B9S32_09215 [Verrucomicrobia bacterium Tous-C9LFEB]
MIPLGVFSRNRNQAVTSPGEDAAQAALKAAFFEYNRSVRIASSKIACMLVIVLMPVGVSLDYLVYPQFSGFFLVLRLICSLLALLLWRLLETSFGTKHFRVLGMGWFVLPSLFISLMIYYADGALSPYYAGLNLVLIAVSWVAQVDFLESLIATGLTLLMYTLACIAHGGGTTSDYFNNYYFIVLTGVIVVTGSYFLNTLRFREYALRSEVDRSRRELEETNAKLVELDRAKSAFFANVSHELRTPLTLLIGPLERLRHPSSREAASDQVEMLDIMYNNAMRLLRLINDLLDLVRLDSGTIRVHRQQVELVPFLEGIAKSVTPMSQQRKLQFDCNLNIPKDCRVHIDRDKVEKIILNLLFNSFKFTPESGTVQLDARMDGDRLVLVVSDTGKGIAAGDLSRIFDRFWQGDDTSTRRFQGVGIGLALVKELAGAHGGSVDVKSEVDKGTVIRVEVNTKEDELMAAAEPLAVKNEVAVDSEWLEGLYRRAEFFPSHVWAGNATIAAPVEDGRNKPLVLVADDEPEMRRFLTAQLKELYTVCEARNGSEALELARSRDFTLILLDLMMPGIDGITLTRLLRETPGTSSVPIVILTARTDEDSKMQALEAGATDFLTKPFASSELAVRCRNLVLWYQLQNRLSAKSKELEEALEQIKQTETHLVHQAKMASLGQLSAGLMHEINNPLNFANTAAHLIRKRLANATLENRESIEKPLQDLMDGIGRVANIVGSLRSFTHPDSSDFGRVDVKDIIETAARFVQIDSMGIALDLKVEPGLAVRGNRNQLLHLLINLLQNASDSLREKSAAEKRIEVGAVLQNGHICLTCWDNGKGIKAQDLTKIFDAFYTTKRVGEGVGLGLSICHRIVKNHQGEIRVESQENEFCRFNVTLQPDRN